MLKLLFAGALSLGYYTGIGVPTPKEVVSVREVRAMTAEYIPISQDDSRIGKMLLFGLVGAGLGGGAGCCMDVLTGCLPIGTCAGACTGGLIGGVAGYVF
ncbi:MAG: hypothetical protein GXO39_07265 [Thermotogae bacterium]|nr:hypothetical protein [Thermotogota bacterium]